MGSGKIRGKNPTGSPGLRRERAASEPMDRRRYFHSGENRWLINVPAESFHVTAADEVLSTTLGSCVSVCVHDPRLRIGGLNHFLLPHEPAGSDQGEALRYGCYSMEHMLDELVRMGALRSAMETKVFGGGSSPILGSDVGNANVAFVVDYLRAEAIAIAASDVGGHWARQVRFYPRTGVARVRRLDLSRAPEIVEDERTLLSGLRSVPDRVELF
jgi:chemotaxis protein CheD